MAYIRAIDALTAMKGENDDEETMDQGAVQAILQDGLRLAGIAG